MSYTTKRKAMDQHSHLSTASKPVFRYPRGYHSRVLSRKSTKPIFRYPPGYHSRISSRESIIDGAVESSSSGPSFLGAADFRTALTNYSQAMTRHNFETSWLSVWLLPPGSQPTDESVQSSGSGQSLSSPIILDPPNSDLYLPHINTYPEMARELPRLLRSPVAWIRDNPRGSGLIEKPIPRGLHHCLTQLSPEAKDGLITGILFAAFDMQRDLKRIRRQCNNRRTLAASQAVKEKERPHPQSPTPQDENSATCVICLKTQIQQATQCGHTFCRDCLNRWMRGQRTCPKCRCPVESVLDIFL